MRSDRYSRILVGALALALVACMDDPTEPATSFDAVLGVASVPAVVLASTGSGSATCAGNGTTISCTVIYTGLTSAPTLSHIHLANAGATGTVRVNLCGAGTAPACPGTTAGTFASGAQTPIALAGQSAGAAYTQVLSAMQAFGAYVNVHTAGNTAGEIRGQLFSVY